MSWFSVFRDADVALAFIRDDIGAGGVGADEFLRALGNARRVKLAIDSSGGDGNIVLPIAEVLVGHDVEATITGRCFSAAAVLALSAGRRMMAADGRVMIHRASAAVYGSELELREASRRIWGTNVRLAEFIRERTGASREKVAQWMMPRKDTYFTAEEALAAGLVHEVVPPVDRPDEAGLKSPEPPAGPSPFNAEDRFFLELLHAFGNVRSGNPERLRRELEAWAFYNVQPAFAP